MTIAGTLTSDQLHFFNSQGYLVIESFSSNEDIDALRKRMGHLLAGFDSSSSASIFSTKNQTSDDYFYESAEKISFFFEEKAFDDDGKLKQAKELSINKVGHALHDNDPIFKKVSCSDKMSGILRSLGYKRPVIIQSMYIFKQPGIGGEVVPHQDNSFLYTDPPSCTGLWLALEDATLVNGCLWAIPGSHKDGLVRRFTGIHEYLQVSPPSVRGTYGSFIQISTCLGLMGALLIGIPVKSISGWWRICFWLSTIPSTLLALAMIFCAESPHWLYKGT